MHWVYEKGKKNRQRGRSKCFGVSVSGVLHLEPSAFLLAIHAATTPD